MVRAQPAWWSRGCGLSEILAYEVSESLVDQSSMADTAMSLEASLCLSGLSLRKIKVFESFTVSHLLCVRSAVSVSSLQRGVTAQR